MIIFYKQDVQESNFFGPIQVSARAKGSQRDRSFHTSTQLSGSVPDKNSKHLDNAPEKDAVHQLEKGRTSDKYNYSGQNFNTSIQTVCGGLAVACVVGYGTWHFSVEQRMEGKISKLEEKVDRMDTKFDQKFTEMDKKLDQKFDQIILMLAKSKRYSICLLYSVDSCRLQRFLTGDRMCIEPTAFPPYFASKLSSCIHFDAGGSSQIQAVFVGRIPHKAAPQRHRPAQTY